jgi:Domain of unknown function (DUF6089)
MRKIFSIIIFAFPLVSVGQNMHDETRGTFLSINGGPSKYLGDIGGHSNTFAQQFALNQNTFFFGAGLQRYYQQKFSWEIGFTSGTLAASDADVKYTSKADPAYLRYRRNLDFKTNINEFNILFHVYPFKFLAKKYKLHQFALQPFVFVGAGYYSFNPQGSYYDAIFKSTIWVDLQPLHTEGQGYAEYPNRKEYNLQQVNIPYGGGLTYFVAENFLVSMAINNRKLFTDYLDDVSTNYIDANVHKNYLTNESDQEQAILMSDKSSLIDPFFSNAAGDIRGNEKKNDAFFSYSLKFSFRIAVKKSKKAKYYKYDDTEKCE